MDLVVDVYALTRVYPLDERFALTSQTRRAAVSIAANIAEGRARESTREYAHHVSIARGSVAELETELLLAERLRYAPPADFFRRASSFTTSAAVRVLNTSSFVSQPRRATFTP